MADRLAEEIAEGLGIAIADPDKTAAFMRRACDQLSAAKTRAEKHHLFERLTSRAVVENLSAMWSADPSVLTPYLFRLRGIPGCAGFSDQLARTIRTGAVEYRPDRGGYRPPSTADLEVVELLGVGRSGRPKNSDRNAYLILRHDQRWEDRIRYCQFSGQTLLDTRRIEDHDEHRIALWLDEHYELTLSVERVGRTVALVARDNPIHPVREYFDGLTWDGVARCSGMFIRLWGAEDTPLNRAIALRFFVGVCARIFRPGSKQDCVVVAVGAQGAGKSTGFEALLPHRAWYGDTAIDLSSKDAFQALSGCVLYEFAELASTRPSAVETVKAFLSSRVDRYRPPYHRNFVEWPRQVTIAAPTNSENFLVDQTGERRYWPIRVRSVNVPQIARERDPLWAEAVQLYRRGIQWWMTPEEDELLRTIHQAHHAADPWERLILDYCEGREEVDVPKICDQLDLKSDRQRRGDVMRIGAILARAGYRQHRIHRGGRRIRVWRLVADD